MFQPSIVGVMHPEFESCAGGIAYLASKSIDKCDSDLKVNLYNNVVLAGGTTLMKNFYEKFKQELNYFAAEQAKTEISVSAALHRKNAAWVGGSMLASFNTFHMMTIKQ
jgi:actin-related protein|mmetsp:Transcript_39582/g.51861  ORF Transcript_39582/g.51861 Transcript_39582/m.51861 type:complete len:109 (-) Transcript_39582:170-496(-)